MRNNISSVLWGVLFIVAGVGFVGNAFGLWNFELFFNGWWTLFIIIPSVVSLVQNGIRPFSLSAFIVGVLLLLSCLGWFDYEIIIFYIYCWSFTCDYFVDTGKFDLLFYWRKILWKACT